MLNVIVWNAPRKKGRFRAKQVCKAEFRKSPWQSLCRVQKFSPFRTLSIPAIEAYMHRDFPTHQQQTRRWHYTHQFVDTFSCKTCVIYHFCKSRDELDLLLPTKFLSEIRQGPQNSSQERVQSAYGISSSGKQDRWKMLQILKTVLVFNRKRTNKSLDRTVDTMLMGRKEQVSLVHDSNRLF